ncbi:hypothetical protein GY12_27400 [Micrococcus luteus]|nr:hypothetical protein GY12_27400 [Micrococcus luteus]
MVDLTAVHGALPSQRLAAYVKRADGDVELAMDYYRWSHALASECWTLISHFEVLLRHRIDTVLADHLRETDRHIPWFLQMGDLPGVRHVRSTTPSPVCARTVASAATKSSQG